MLSRQNRAKSNLLVRLFSSSSSSSGGGGGGGGGGPNDNGNNNKWSGESVAAKIILEKVGSSSSYGHPGAKNDPLDAIFEQFADPLGMVRFRHFTLPGNVTTADSYKKLMVPAHSKVYPAADQLFNNGQEQQQQESGGGGGGGGSPEQFQQMEIIRHFGTAVALSNQNRLASDEEEGEGLDVDEYDDDQSPLGVLSRVRCAAHECPALVRKDFFDSFPEVNFKNQQQQKLTVVTIAEKSRDPSAFTNNNRNTVHKLKATTKNDNDKNGPFLVKNLNQDDSSLSSKIDNYDDRAKIDNQKEKIDNFNTIITNQADFIGGDIHNNSEELKEQQKQLKSPTFINAAQEICKLLQAAGYWADFVDPFSGKLFSGDFPSNASLLDAERALDRFAGVTVESSGACKVISHHVTNQKRSRVGVVFTTASFDSPILKLIVAAQQEAEQQQRENKENLERAAAERGEESRGQINNNSNSQSASTSSDSHVTSSTDSSSRSNRKNGVGGALAILGKHY